MAHTIFKMPQLKYDLKGEVSLKEMGCLGFGQTNLYTRSLLDAYTLASKERVYGLFRPMWIPYMCTYNHLPLLKHLNVAIANGFNVKTVSSILTSQTYEKVGLSAFH